MPDYPDIQISQGLHRLPTNTTYWTNWPDAENPYVNTAHWHLTWPFVVHNAQASRPVVNPSSLALLLRVGEKRVPLPPRWVRGSGRCNPARSYPVPLDYVAKRIGMFFLIVWLAATINFFLPRLGGKTRSEPDALEQAARAAACRPVSKR